MKTFFKQRWFLLVVLVVFTICKLPSLSYPYFWDESWPYAPAIRQMFMHGISLMPNAVDSEISRGHPLFFHAIAALWMHIFGSSHIAMHCFALTISLLFLIAIFETGARLFNVRAACLAIILVASQEIFFVQSSFVLLEMLLAFLVFMSLYFYVKEKYILTAITLTALFYTKESGLIMGAVLGIDAFFSMFGKTYTTRKKILKLSSIVIPVILIGVFFVLQKVIRGWYVFPFYSGIIEHNWLSFWYRFRMGCVRAVFYENYKYFDFVLLLLLSIVVAIKQKKIGYLVLWIPGTIIYYYVDDMRAGRLLPSIPFFIVFIISVWFMLFELKRSKLFDNAYEQKYITLSVWFIIVFLCFSATNFFTYRYLLSALIPLLFLTAVLLTKFTELSYKALYYPIIAAILITSFYAFKDDHNYGDTDMGVFKAMEVQQSAIGFLERNNYYDKTISTGGFIEGEHLTDPNTGFLKTTKVFKHIKWAIDSATDLVLFDATEPDGRIDEIKNDTSFRVVFKDQKDSVWTVIYEHKK